MFIEGHALLQLLTKQVKSHRSMLLTDGTIVGDSARSRIGKIVEISNLTQQDAWRYLVPSRKVANEKDVYEQIHGRLSKLQVDADGLQGGRDLAGVSFPAQSSINVERNRNW